MGILNTHKNGSEDCSEMRVSIAWVARVVAIKTGHEIVIFGEAPIQWGFP